MTDRELNSLSGRIDLLCDRFEVGLKSGRPTRIEDLLDGWEGTECSELLRQLLAVEIEFRRAHEEDLTIEEFTGRFPDQTELIQDVFATLPPVQDTAKSTISPSDPANWETVDVSLASADETVVPDSSATDSSEPTGKRFGDYELLEELGRGGMGVVYKARQTALNRIVALKMIRSGELADHQEIQRFHSEAEAAAQLDHPGIVPIYQVGAHDGQHFFSMGYVEGEGLDARLKDGPLPPKEAADLIRKIAEAVQYAHEKGIVHRDLKPANILLASGGRQSAEVNEPKITDFGLAKNIAVDSGMTATGQVLGTPSYMPPEQAAGKVDQIGPAADVYSLGAMLYCTLTGRPPFQAANVMDTLHQVLHSEPVSPRVLNPAVDRDLETICLRCLAKRQDDRFFNSAAELADDLQRYLNDVPVRVRRIGSAARFGRWCRKTWQERRRWIVTTAGVISLAIVALVVSLQRFEQSRQESTLADLRSRFETGLAASKWDAGHLKQMDELAASLEAAHAGEGNAARERLEKRFTEIVRSAIRQPRIDSEEARQIEGWLTLLQSRNTAVAKQLRREFDDRKTRMEFVFKLEPPFDSVGSVFEQSDVALKKGSLLAARRKFISLTRVTDGSQASLEATFGPEWVRANRVGLVLNGTRQQSYSFELLLLPSKHANKRPQSFQEVRELQGRYVLRIKKHRTILRAMNIPAQTIRPGKLQIAAARNGQQLTVSINNTHRLAFFDIFPLATGEAKFGVIWPTDVPLQQLYGSRRVVPAAPGALEKGDGLFLAGDYAAARAFYQSITVQSADTVEGLEAEVKEGLCLLAGNELEQAARLFELAVRRPVASTAVGRRWRDAALAQLLLTRIRQNRHADAEALIEQIELANGTKDAAGFALSTVAPRTLTDEVINRFLLVSATSANWWQPDPNRVRKLELAIRIADLLEIPPATKANLLASLVHAHCANGDVETARRVAEQFLADRGFNPAIVSDYAWLSRTAFPPGARRNEAMRKALAELDRQLFLNPEAKDPAERFRPSSHKLLIERARLHAALGDARQAAADVDSYFRFAPQPQQSFQTYSHACLLRGFLYDDAGEPDKAMAFWKKAIYPGNFDVTKDNNRFDGSTGLINALIAAGLTKGMQERDVEQMVVGAMKLRHGEIAERLVRLAKAGGIRPIMLTDMWRTPRGRDTARKHVFRSVPFLEYIRLLPVLFAAHLTHKTALYGSPTDDQQQLIWETYDEGFRKVLSNEIQVSFFQLAGLGAVWKGIPTGWIFLKTKLPAPLRARATYILGLRYRRLGKTQQATTYFREALAGASSDKLLQRLAKEALQPAKPN